MENMDSVYALSEIYIDLGKPKKAFDTLMKFALNDPNARVRMFEINRKFKVGDLGPAQKKLIEDIDRIGKKKVIAGLLIVMMFFAIAGFGLFTMTKFYLNI